MVVVLNATLERAAQMNITTMGLDLAKNVFQVHGINDGGDVIVRRRRGAQVF